MNKIDRNQDFAELTDAMRDIQKRLATLTDGRGGADGQGEYKIEPELLPTRAARLYRTRRRRDMLFGADADLFGEAAWDILLDLYAARQSDRQVCISSASIASVAPISTGLRYIASLERRGLVARTPDPVDRRRSWLNLTERAVALMEEYLSNPEV